MNKAGVATYQTQGILTASPARRVAMLYEAAITSLRKAIDAIEQGEIEARWRANQHAADIIEHLLMTLDFERGGEIAENLDRLYKFMIRHLIDVDLRNDPQPARDVIKLLEPLHRSWRELDRKIAAEGAAAMAASGETPDGPGSETGGDRVYATA